MGENKSLKHKSDPLELLTFLNRVKNRKTLDNRIIEESISENTNRDNFQEDFLDDGTIVFYEDEQPPFGKTNVKKEKDMASLKKILDGAMRDMKERPCKVVEFPRRRQLNCVKAVSLC